MPEISALRRRGVCLVLAGPSGGGKTTIMECLVRSEPSCCRSVSATTRAPREGEVHAVDYYFQSVSEFQDMLSSGGFLENSSVFGRFYGIPRLPVEKALADGIDVVMVVDWQGHQKLLQALPGDVVGVYLMPPSRDVLEARLRGRGDSKEMIAERMQSAHSEVSHCGEFKHIVVNQDLANTIETVREILRAARTEAKRQIGLKEAIENLKE